jgi:hypothetical protein
MLKLYCSFSSDEKLLAFYRRHVVELSRINRHSYEYHAVEQFVRDAKEELARRGVTVPVERGETVSQN